MVAPLLVSQRTAAALLSAAGCCNEPQSRLLMHAHVCGEGWLVYEDTDPQALDRTLTHADPPHAAKSASPSGSEKETRMWALSDVVAVANRPRLTTTDLADALPCDIAIVVRQTSRRDLPPGKSPENPVNRTYYGVDATIARSKADDAQRDASRMLWRLSPSRRARIAESITTHGGVPLLVSCGGYLITGWTITGFDDDITQGLDLAAFTLAPQTPRWREAIAERWFNSGPGQPLALLDLTDPAHASTSAHTLSA